MLHTDLDFSRFFAETLLPITPIIWESRLHPSTRVRSQRMRDALFLNDIRISPGQRCQTTVMDILTGSIEDDVCVVQNNYQVKDKEICQIPRRHFFLSSCKSERVG